MEKNKCWTLPQKVLELQSRVDDIDIDIPIMKEDISKKVDKVTQSLGRYSAYVVSPDGSQDIMGVDTKPVAYFLPRYDGDGRLKTNNPANNSDVVNLQYANDNFINKKYIEPTLLWTNPNPTSAFAQQTLNLNIAPYKYIVVTFNRFDGYTTPIQKFINKGGNSTVFTMYGARLAVRTFTIGIQQVALGNATYYDLNTTSGVTNNQYLIPLEIYGTNTL